MPDPCESTTTPESSPQVSIPQQETKKMATVLDDAIMAAMVADAAEAVAIRRSDVMLATARQRDGAAFDMRTLDGWMANQLSAASDPATFALINGGVRVPTTLDHPSVPVSNPVNTGGH